MRTESDKQEENMDGKNDIEGQMGIVETVF